MEERYYGVSSGDGNNGVSHMFPDYYVKTDQPYRLAKLAALTTFKKGEGEAWALKNMEVDGEAESTIYVTFYESPEAQEERSVVQNELDACEDEERAKDLQRQLENFQDYAW